MSNSNVVTAIIEATELAFGRNPSINWIDQVLEMTYAPETGDNDTSNIGVDVVDAISVYLLLGPRFKQGAKTAFYQIVRSTWTTGYDYQIILTGDGYGPTTFTGTGESSVEATVASLVADINTASTGNLDPVAVGVSSSSDGVIDTVMVYAIGVPSVPTAPILVCDIATDHPDGVVEGTGGFLGYTDPASFSARVWVKMTSPATLPITVPWMVPFEGDIGAIPAEGDVRRINAAGFERLYVEIYDVVAVAGGDATMIQRLLVLIAPAIPEE